MPRLQRDGQTSFTGGLAVLGAGEQIAKDQLLAARNFRLQRDGALCPRRGTWAGVTAPLTNGVAGGFLWHRPGVAPLSVFVSNGTLYSTQFNVGQQPALNSHGGALGTPIGYRVPLVEFRDGSTEVVYLATSTGLWKWTGGGAPVLVTPTPYLYLAVYNNRLFAVPQATPNTLVWSGLSNGDSLGVPAGGGGAAVIQTFNADFITALAVAGGALLIFFRNSISRFTGWSQDDINIASGTSGVSPDRGNIAPGGVCVDQDRAYMLGEDGVYAVSSGGLQLISQSIGALWRDGLTPSQQLGMEAAQLIPNPADEELLLWLPGYGIMAYHLRHRAWMGPWTVPSSDGCRGWLDLDHATRRPLVVLGTSWLLALVSGGMDTARYDGEILTSTPSPTANFTAELLTRPLTWKDDATTKGLRYAYAHGQSNWDQFWATLTVERDDVDSETVEMRGPELPVRAHIGGTAMEVKLRLLLDPAYLGFRDFDDLALTALEVEGAPYARRF